MKKFRRCYHPPISPQHFQHSTKKRIMDPLHQTTSPSSAWRGAATLAPTPTAMESPTKRSLKGFPFESKSHGFGFFFGGKYERWSICSAISGHEIQVFELIFLTKSWIPKSLKVGFLAECVWDLLRKQRTPLNWKVWCQVYRSTPKKNWENEIAVSGCLAIFVIYIRTAYISSGVLDINLLMINDFPWWFSHSLQAEETNIWHTFSNNSWSGRITTPWGRNISANIINKEISEINKETNK